MHGALPPLAYPENTDIVVYSRPRPLAATSFPFNY
jgi:hypothetical protein